MRSKVIQQILRVLLGLLGAGVGAAVAMGGLQLYRYANPETVIPIPVVLLCYIALSLFSGVIVYAFARRIIHAIQGMFSEMVSRFDRMPVSQLVASMLGLLLGLVAAALVSQILHFMGSSMFTTVLSMILYLTFSLLGYTIFWRRSTDLMRFAMHLSGFRGRRFSKKGKKLMGEAAGQQIKLLDTSALIDGRILEVCRTGFVEGELVAPEFVVSELRHIADSTDSLRRAKGRRGLDVLQKMQESLKQTVRTDGADYPDTDEVDVKLLRLARRLNAAVITGDYNLAKAAAVTGVRTLNVNELAGALRPAVHAGDELTVTVVKEGKEPGQGVAYMEDGTMVVVEGGRQRMNETMTVIVTSALQTSAGRMIFAKPA